MSTSIDGLVCTTCNEVSQPGQICGCPTRRSQSTSASRIEVSSEDFQILVHRVGVDVWCLYAQGDGYDAEMMTLREREKSKAKPHERWETNRRRWFPSGWGL